MGRAKSLLEGSRHKRRQSHAELSFLQEHKVAPVGTSQNIDRYDPDTWTDEFAHLSLLGQSKIQADLFYDYQTNVAAYPAWQAWMRQHKPPMLVVWGKYDPSFAV